jgi:mono/diheme cytochrome c family protein
MRYGILQLAWCVAALSLCQVAGAGQENKPVQSHNDRPGAATRSEVSSVTPVDGPSWLEHVGRFLDQTSMGKTGAWGPEAYPENKLPRTEQSYPAWLTNQQVVLSGSDVYRLNCQACHHSTGEGVPPEINSIIDPVHATSRELIVDRMKKAGAPITPATARQLASQAETSLLLRIHNGGDHMPPFPQMSEVEVRALRDYLNQLAGISGAENRQVHIEEPAIRVGEHLVKSTCHICHSATGRNPTPQQLLDGAIPPLSVLSTRTNLHDFVRKVTDGAPIVMGPLDLQHRGRMPVFYYVTKDEAAAAYLYLTLCPPQDNAPAVRSTPDVRPRMRRAENKTWP